jgi:hypothetical protein
MTRGKPFCQSCGSSNVKIFSFFNSLDEEWMECRACKGAHISRAEED